MVLIDYSIKEVLINYSIKEIFCLLLISNYGTALHKKSENGGDDRFNLFSKNKQT